VGLIFDILTQLQITIATYLTGSEFKTDLILPVSSSSYLTQIYTRMTESTSANSPLYQRNQSNQQNGVGLMVRANTTAINASAKLKVTWLQQQKRTRWAAKHLSPERSQLLEDSGQRGPKL
jgi:hypothetical protein